MYKNKKLLALLLVAAVLSVAGCRTAEPAIATPQPIETQQPVEIFPLEEAIVGIMADRLLALETADYDLYMSAIGQNNQFFYDEQERWYNNMTDESISLISFKIESVEKIDDNTGVVTILQRHKLEKIYPFKYPLLFKLEDGKWMDYGYNFNVVETDRFQVKYMDGETRVEEFTQMLNVAYDNMEKLYTVRPVDNYEMKLFKNQELLRERSTPAHTWLFTGWSEPDESLKIFTGHPLSYQGYPGVIQHELVHHITINICNGNLPGWILEGIAMYDGSAPHGFQNSSALASMTQEGIHMTIAELEAMDLSDVASRREIVDFYTTGYMYVRYIDEIYGREKLMDIFYEAGKLPFQDSALDDEYEIKNQATADEVLLTVLGLTKAQLSQEYLAWLATIDFDSIG